MAATSAATAGSPEHTSPAETRPYAPGAVRVIRRNGKVTQFDASKINVAITKAFLAVEGAGAAASRRIHETVDDLTGQVVRALLRRLPTGGTIHIEDIQDQVELALMRSEHQKVARAYVLYREEHSRLRAERAKEAEQPAAAALHVTRADGTRQPLDEARLRKVVDEACAGLANVDGGWILEETRRNLFDGVPEKDLAPALVMTARTRIEHEPNYSQVAARLLLDNLRREALTFLGNGPGSAVQAEMAERYGDYFADYVKRGVELELLSPELQRYDLARLGAALDAGRDLQFTYLGLQTLYDRYFIHSAGQRFELPQAFFMRVAMGLAAAEIDREDKAIEFYRLLSSFDFMSSTPTLFNAGTLRPQLSSCYLTTVPDDLDGIYSAIKDNALLSKYAGGLGNDWTRVRGLGAYIKGTNGKSRGVIPFLKVANDTAVAVNQGGKRLGAVCAYLETWHIDMEEFLELRKNTGDDRRRTHDMNTANWIPDLFMKRVAEEGQWTLFSPNDTPDLHDLTGAAFEKAYLAYEEKVDHGEISLYKRIPALSLWRKMLSMLFETGHPWITFKDPCNLRSPQQHVGVVHSSNLCSEITLNTSDNEIAVCFPKGTLILTSEGQKPIEECDGCNVYVPFSADLKSQQRLLKAKLMLQGKKQVYELKTRNGIVIKATENHLFLVQLPVVRDEPKAYQWKKLNELDVGDFLVCPLTESIYADIGVQDEDFTAAGWMLGDGWMSSSYGVCFGSHEAHAQAFVLPILNRWHQASELGHNTPHTNPPTPYVQPNGVVNWHTQRQGFITYVQDRFGFHKATGPHKSIGQPIKAASPNQIASFLSGLYSADGCVMHNKQRIKGGVTVSLASASLTLLRDVQMLLKPFGVHGRIRGCHVSGRESRWQGQLEILGSFSILNFIRFIGFSLSPIKQQKLAELLPFLSNRAAFQHTAVVSIIAKEAKEVFDLALEEDHNFIANGLVVHNCNLGSVNLAAHIADNGELDGGKLEKTVSTAMRMLDNVIDINYYSVPQARRANLRHRPVGLGLMGFQDALYKKRIAYATAEAVQFADSSMEAISYYAIKASTDLAAERGRYSTFEGSLWAKGILPIDSIELLEEQRGGYLQQDRAQTLDWDGLRERVKTVGMRNSNTMAIAPTATISNIVGVAQSIEPTYQNLFVKSNLSGEFTVVNPFLVRDLKALGLWDAVMINDLKYYDGSVQPIERIPSELKALYATAFEVDARWLVEAASRRQKWIDQGQSLNLYLSEPNGKKLDTLYKLAWVRGLKTTYYLRSMGATHVEKSTLADGKLNQVAVDPLEELAPAKLCSIDNPECEACQ